MKLFQCFHLQKSVVYMSGLINIIKKTEIYGKLSYFQLQTQN